MVAVRRSDLTTLPALFRAAPRAAELFPWLSLGRFPTRVHRVDGLLPPSIDLWIKREDESSPAYGGNKVRKLEFMLGDARARDCRRVVTFGGTGSHHVVATAIHGALAGFEVDAVLVPQPIDAHVRELVLASQGAGAHLLGARGYLGVLPDRLGACRPGVAWLGGGGSSPIGTLGWVSGALEIAAQIRTGELPRPDVLYAALGSCGTVAGLLSGLCTPRAIELVAVRVVGGPFCGEGTIRRLARGVARLLSPLKDDDAFLGERPRLRIESRFLGAGYGRASPASLSAVKRTEPFGLGLDPIYTGKVMAALLADARAGRLDGKRVLFLHSFSSADLSPMIARSPGPAGLPARLRALFADGEAP